MKKPTKKPQIMKQNCHVFDMCGEYTPNELRSIADDLDSRDVEAIEISSVFYDSFTVKEIRYERPSEYEKRYNSEMKKYQTYKKKEEERKSKKKEKLIKEAKKLGLKVEEKD